MLLIYLLLNVMDCPNNKYVDGYPFSQGKLLV